MRKREDSNRALCMNGHRAWCVCVWLVTSMCKSNKVVLAARKDLHFFPMDPKQKESIQEGDEKLVVSGLFQ